MKTEQHFFEKTARRPMTDEEEEKLRRKYSIVADPESPRRKRVVATAMAILKRAKSRVIHVSRESTIPDPADDDEAAETERERAERGIRRSAELHAAEQRKVAKTAREGTCLCGAEGRPHAPASIQGCAHLYVEPCDEVTAPESSADDDSAVESPAPGVAEIISVSQAAAEMDAVGQGIADAVLDNAVEVVRESIETGTRDATFAVTDAAAESDANASACISVWLAPAKPCTATKDGSHGFSNPTERPGHADITPYCPQCHEFFTRGPRPDPGDNPDVAYVTFTEARQSRRLTGT